MTLKARVTRLEATVGNDDEVTLRELVDYSFRTEPDPAFLARFGKSALGRLMMTSIFPYRGDVLSPGTPPKRKTRMTERARRRTGATCKRTVVRKAR